MQGVTVVLSCFFLLVLNTGSLGSTQNECASRYFGDESIVCVCNSTYCDTLSPVEAVHTPNYVIYTSNKAGLRFQKENGTFNSTQTNKNVITIKDKEYQEIKGWGGAISDAAAINIMSLDDDVKEKLMRSYYGKDGIEYNLCRVPIGGSDFSTRAYTLDDVTNDVNLTHFNLTSEDLDYKIPVIQQALNLTNSTLQLFGSTWSAPKWMKSNNNYSGIGFLKSSMYQSWADYFLNFLDAYSKHNITFWGITTGNEPSLAYFPTSIQKIPSTAWTPTQMRTFIRENLGPTLRKSNHSDIKIMALDDQRIFLPWFIKMVFDDSEAKNYVDGIAVHWYQDKIAPAFLLTLTHYMFQDKFILATEACRGDKSDEPAVILGSWTRGEDYASSIIDDINNWVTGWLDWNIALDVLGGPTYIDNNVDSPIIVNTTSQEFYKQPMYYALGHFSKFVPKGSKKISTTQLLFKNAPVTAFKRPDGGIVVVILNRGNSSLPVVISDESRGNINLNLTERSITTVLYY